MGKGIQFKEKKFGELQQFACCFNTEATLLSKAGLAFRQRGCLPEPSFHPKAEAPSESYALLFTGLINGRPFSFLPKLPLTGPAGQQPQAHVWPGPVGDYFRVQGLGF